MASWLASAQSCRVASILFCVRIIAVCKDPSFSCSAKLMVQLSAMLSMLGSASLLGAHQGELYAACFSSAGACTGALTVSVPLISTVQHTWQTVLGEGGLLRDLLAQEASLWGRLTGCFGRKRSEELVAWLQDSLASRVNL